MGAFELRPATDAQAIVVGGDSSEMFLRTSDDGLYLQTWSGASARGVALRTYAMDSLAIRTPDRTEGMRVWLDFSAGNPIPSGGLVLAGDDELIVETSEANRQQLLATTRSLVASGRISSTLSSKTQGLSIFIGTDNELRISLAIHGDLDRSGILDGDDYFALDRAFFAQEPSVSQADINCDGQIDGGDYHLIDHAFLTIHSASAQAAVPAPSGIDPLRIGSVRDLLDVQDER
jgi:hypothetical protein